jgi:uncharacterized membrane protein
MHSTLNWLLFFCSNVFKHNTTLPHPNHTIPYQPNQIIPDHIKHHQTTPYNEQTRPNHTTQQRQQQPTTLNQTKHNNNTDRDRNSKPKYNFKTSFFNTSIQTRGGNLVEIMWKVVGNKLERILEGAGQDVIDTQKVLSRNSLRIFKNRAHPNTANKIRF